MATTLHGPSYTAPTGQTSEPASPDERAWTALWIFALRAVGLYFLFYYLVSQVGDRALPKPLDLAEHASLPLDWVSHHFAPWIATRIFGFRDLAGGGNGMGDGPLDWAQTVLFAAIAISIAAVWTAIRPQMRHPERAHEWLRAFLRYPLAFTMIEYGVVKFTRTQFGVLPLHQQMTPVGECSAP